MARKSLKKIRGRHRHCLSRTGNPLPGFDCERYDKSVLRYVKKQRFTRRCFFYPVLFQLDGIFPCSLQIVKPWKQKDHLLLAKTLAAALQLSYGRKMAFILGSLIPDINPLSYLSPSCEKKFDGHSYEYRRRFIEESLKVSSCNRCTDWYRAGVAVHYLADSFYPAP